MKYVIIILASAAAGFILKTLLNDLTRPAFIVDWVLTDKDLNKFIGVEKMELREGFHVDVEIKPKTVHGHAAAIQPGSAQVNSSNPSVIGVGPNPDDPNNELKFRISGLDGSSNESAVVEFRCDGDVGEGVRELISTKSVVCTQGNAVVVDMEVGEPVEDVSPEPQPEPAAVDPEVAGANDANGSNDADSDANLNDSGVQDPNAENSGADPAISEG